MLKKVNKVNKVIICIGMVFILSACSSPEADVTENIADDGISGIKPPEGCQVIENIKDFESVTGDQSYNRETDASTSFNNFRCTDKGDTLYVFNNRNLLTYFDKETGNSALVCGKPECEHLSLECNAYIDNTWGLQYYDGYIYTVVSNFFELERISYDGSYRENLGKLINTETVNTGADTGWTVNWMIHRDYIYYCYMWNAGITEDTYYLNNSNCVFRKSLEKDSEPECIMELPVMASSSNCQFIGVGSYIYMIIPNGSDTVGSLYRYNTETKKLEWFKEWGDKISGVMAINNKIYYSENNNSENKTEIYCYDSETQEKNLFFEIDGLVRLIRYDNDFIYITYEVAEEKYDTAIWNIEGEYLAKMPDFREENRMGSLVGSDNNNVYIWYRVILDSDKENIYADSLSRSYEIIEYIEKEDILDGEYEIREWSEIAEE